MRPQIKILVVVSSITFAMVMAGISTIEWGFVHIEFTGFDHSLRVMDVTVGLQEAELVMWSHGLVVKKQQGSFGTLGATLSHLPVFRSHGDFERAGIVAYIFLSLSQAAFFIFAVLVVVQLLFGATTYLGVAVGSAFVQGLLALAGNVLWALLRPGVGVGKTYGLDLLWGFTGTVTVACFQVSASILAAVWTYRVHMQEYRLFSKLPTAQDDDDDAPVPESQEDGIAMHRFSHGNAQVEPDEEEDDTYL